VRTAELKQFFEERFIEVESYLALLETIADAARSGPPKIAEVDVTITATQQKILYSSLYLQLYNLVEATVSRCLETVSEAAASHSGNWQAADLNDSLRREWVRTVARTHTELSYENRLQSALEMCNHLVSQLPIQQFEIEIGGGGNWDDEAIEKIGDRVGCHLLLSKEVKSQVKRPLRDDKGAMKLIKDRRNGLAHGRLSFVDCADGVAVQELRDITDVIGAYLREVINCFVKYIDVFGFLLPERKPSDAA
jgi:MAE_28990/MAE_18760-like HEPN